MTTAIRTRKRTPCQSATRRHKHAGTCPECGKPILRVTMRGHQFVVHDDGSVCARDVTPTPPTFPPERVLALFLSGREEIERNRKRPGQ